MRTKRVLPAIAVSGLVLISCGGDDSSDAMAEAVATYADGVHASYAASAGSATAMDTAIDAFLADPTDATLDAARQSWLDARDDYGLTEAFRFYGGPIDDEEDGPEGLINAWPMDEAYVDYVEGDPDAGIINDADHVPDDRRRPAGVAERGRRRDQHLHRLARDRVPALGSGPAATTARATARSATTPTRRTPTGARSYLATASDLLVGAPRRGSSTRGHPTSTTTTAPSSWRSIPTTP